MRTKNSDGTRLIGDAHAFCRAARAIPLVRVFPVHQIAFKRLYYGIYVPLRPVVVPEQVFDARPVRLTVELAGITLIKKFTMLLTHILLVLFAVFDFHRLPLVWLGGNSALCLSGAMQGTVYRVQCNAQFIKRNREFLEHDWQWESGIELRSASARTEKTHLRWP